ncbi:MAG TPA: winged helix-turn-helix domain-containing protein [Candidatus Sulfotelmatobacter sp.]|nr:winged helix-turn-helix domain-containing protein [Candidatus Sulfotelmatobacter sp.]
MPNSQVMRFGTYEVDLRLGELRKNGKRVKLTGQPFQILVILLEHSGDLVTREQLQQRLWPSDTFVDFDSGLNAAINRVREALGDSAENPRFVETLPRRGYRFIAAIKIDSRPTTATLPAAESNVSPTQTITRQGALPASEASERRPLSRRLLLGGVFMLTVVAVAVALLSRLSRRSSGWGFQAMKLSRVTQSGNAINVAISPDGRYAVYVLREGEKQSLNVRQVATGSDVQILPPDEVVIWSLTFSPDANYIDFVRGEKPDFTDTHLYRMPVLGGTPYLAMQGGIDFGSSYSPDGRQFAFLRVANSGPGTVDVLIAKADGSNQRVVASRPYRDADIGLAWSPDGKKVAFTTSEATKKLRSSLWAISIADGSVREIYATPDTIGRPRWVPDGSGLLAPIGNAGQAFRGQLWFISYPKGEAHRLTNDLMDYQLCCLDLTPDGKTLVDTELSTVSDLWLAPGGNTARAKQITTKEFAVGGFSWMPDGRIIFASQDGNLYVVNQDGSGRTRLTPDDSSNWDPSVCGDGRYIVYAAYREQKRGIWRMSADGSNPIRIADETFAIRPQCSPDGKWVVYVRGPSWTPVKVPITGAKPPEVLAQDFENGFGNPLRISPDGKRIMYLASPQPPQNASSASANSYQLKVIPSDGGPALYKFDWPASASAPLWAPAGDAVEYALTRSGVTNIWRQKLSGGPPKQITNFGSGQIFGFAWSHDGRQLALTRGSESSDVILISDFR